MSTTKHSFTLSPTLNEFDDLSKLLGCVENIEYYFGITIACAVENDQPIFYPDLEDAGDSDRLVQHDGKVIDRFFRRADGTICNTNTHSYRFDITYDEDSHLKGTPPFINAKITCIASPPKTPPKKIAAPRKKTDPTKSTAAKKATAQLQTPTLTPEQLFHLLYSGSIKISFLSTEVQTLTFLNPPDIRTSPPLPFTTSQRTPPHFLATHIPTTPLPTDIPHPPLGFPLSPHLENLTVHAISAHIPLKTNQNPLSAITDWLMDQYRLQLKKPDITAASPQ